MSTRVDPGVMDVDTQIALIKSVSARATAERSATWIWVHKYLCGWLRWRIDTKLGPAQNMSLMLVNPITVYLRSDPNVG